MPFHPSEEELGSVAVSPSTLSTDRLYASGPWSRAARQLYLSDVDPMVLVGFRAYIDQIASHLHR